MKRKHVAKMVSAVLVTTMLMGLAGCGSSGTKDATQSGSSSSTGDEGIASDSPYAGKGYDLSEKKTVVMYVLGIHRRIWMKCWRRQIPSILNQT